MKLMTLKQQDNKDKHLIGWEHDLGKVDWKETNLFMDFEMRAIIDNLNFFWGQFALGKLIGRKLIYSWISR